MRRAAIPAFVAAALIAAAVPVGVRLIAAQDAHQLPLAPHHVHWGYYDASVKPVLTINSGDRVRVETMVARGVERLRLAGAADN